MACGRDHRRRRREALSSRVPQPSVARGAGNQIAGTAWKGGADFRDFARLSQPGQYRQICRLRRCGSISNAPTRQHCGFRSRQPWSSQYLSANIRVRDYLTFSLQPTFAKKCQQRVMTITPRRAEAWLATKLAASSETRAERRDVVIC